MAAKVWWWHGPQHSTGVWGPQRLHSVCPLPCRYMVDAADQEKIEASKNELHNLLDKPQLQGIPVSCCLDRSPTSCSQSPGWWLPGFAARGLHFAKQIQGGDPSPWWGPLPCCTPAGPGAMTLSSPGVGQATGRQALEETRTIPPPMCEICLFA